MEWKELGRSVVVLPESDLVDQEEQRDNIIKSAKCSSTSQRTNGDRFCQLYAEHFVPIHTRSDMINNQEDFFQETPTGCHPEVKGTLMDWKEIGWTVDFQQIKEEDADELREESIKNAPRIPAASSRKEGFRFRELHAEHFTAIRSVSILPSEGGIHVFTNENRCVSPKGVLNSDPCGQTSPSKLATPPPSLRVSAVMACPSEESLASREQSQAHPASLSTPPQRGVAIHANTGPRTAAQPGPDPGRSPALSAPNALETAPAAAAARAPRRSAGPASPSQRAGDGAAGIRPSTSPAVPLPCGSTAALAAGSCRRSDRAGAAASVPSPAPGPGSPEVCGP